MGRPRKTTPTVMYTVRLSLTPGEDDDLIAFLDAAPVRCRAMAVKAAMRGGNLSVQAADEGEDAALLAALDEFLI